MSNFEILATAIVKGLISANPPTQNGLGWLDPNLKITSPSFFWEFDKLIERLESAKVNKLTVEEILEIEHFVTALENAKFKAFPED